MSTIQIKKRNEKIIHERDCTTNNFVPKWHLTEQEHAVLLTALAKLVKAIRKGLHRKNVKEYNGLICPICLGDQYTGFMNSYSCIKRKCRSRRVVNYKYFMNHMEEFIGDILLGVELYGRTRDSGSKQLLGVN